VRYVAYRDRTSPQGRVFGRDVDLVDRREFLDYVARSTKGLEPKWVADKDGKRVDRQRAVYTFILSPEDWRGLDLRRLTREAMRQLEVDAGPNGIGPWFAAEHRNTAHHHVHIVVAARREVAAGRFSTLVVTRKRLQRMKDAIAIEVERQRGQDRGSRPQAQHTAGPVGRREPVLHQTLRWRSPVRRATASRMVELSPRFRVRPKASATLLHLHAVARFYHHRMEHELEQEQLRAEREGWVR
jgi:hypothetical protein